MENSAANDYAERTSPNDSIYTAARVYHAHVAGQRCSSRFFPAFFAMGFVAGMVFAAVLAGY